MMKRFSIKEQQGAVLVVGLIFLALMTLVVVTAMRTGILDEKMAGNLRDTKIAFQAAEAALLRAERDVVESLIDLSTFDGNRTTAGHEGRYSLGQDEPAVNTLFTATTWTSGNASTSYASSLGGINTQPRWMAKVVQIDGPLNLSMKSETGVVFRITGRGTGGSDQTQVVLRSFYRKFF
jgi:type IV pilus assembly protein PilX